MFVNSFYIIMILEVSFMTAMNVLIESNAITLSMDTLVSTRDKSGGIVPAYFTQKFNYYPFTKSILCGTGNYNVIQKAMAFSESILSREVITYTEMMSDFLFENKFNLNKETATIYIFGFDENLLLHAFALRSTNNYEIEEIANYERPNIIIKPGYQAAINYLNSLRNEDTDDLLIKLMRKEKEIDAAAPLNKKVGIGGENVVISLIPNDGKLLSVVKVIDVFNDYDEQYQYCLDRINDY